MKFETIKKDNKKKYIIASIVVIAIIVTITYISTRAKYKITSSVQLARGTINYSPTDFEIVSIKIQNSDGSYQEVETVPTTGYELNTTKTVCKVKEANQDVTMTYTNGKLSINGLTGKLSINGLTTKGTKCEIYFDKKLCPEGATSCELILLNNTIDTSRASGEFTSAFTDNTAGKIFSSTDNDGTTYFFAGTNQNNWVQFGGFYWRIIRINGNGSIRLIYSGTTTTQTGEKNYISKNTFNDNDDDNAYVGFMYGTPGSSTYSATHTNTYSSRIKGVLDTWYTTNLKTNYEKYIDTNAGFCGDRTLDKVSGYHYVGDGYKKYVSGYISFGRIYDTNYKSTQIATYKCNQTNDLYTVSGAISGNKALTNSIGLITSDEVIYAGGFGGNEPNTSYWLYIYYWYWTMSPSDFNGGSANVLSVGSSGNVTSGRAASSGGIRPVINLKKDALTTGSGTTADPYRVS